MKTSYLFQEDWSPTHQYRSVSSLLKQIHRIITLALGGILLGYALLRSTFTWVGAALVVVSIIAIIDFRAIWNPSLRDEVIVIGITSAIFFIGALVEQNVAVYFDEAPETHHLSNFGIGLIFALLLFGRLECSLWAMEFNRRAERLLEPISYQATQILQTAYTHAKTLGPIEAAEEPSEIKEFHWDLRILIWTLGLGIFTMAIFAFAALLISVLLPLHPQLREIVKTIRPETFLFILISIAVTMILLIDQGLKKASRESAGDSPASQLIEKEEVLKEV